MNATASFLPPYKSKRREALAAGAPLPISGIERVFLEQKEDLRICAFDRGKGSERMKILCNACEQAEATVMCCSDEAALCGACDEKIHSANKLARKHLRVPLSNSSSPMPQCDICQETAGYFFCLEDRALFCRNCDVSIHTANPLVSLHQRFLLTGVKVGLESKGSVPSQEMLSSVETGGEVSSKPFFKSGYSTSSPGNAKSSISSQVAGDRRLTVNKSPFSGGSIPDIIPEWPLEDFLGMTDCSQNYGFMEQGSSKVNSAKSEDNTECSPVQQAAIGDADIDEYMSQVPEVPWSVPKIPSPPTASGLYWPKKINDNFFADDSAFVPEIYFPNEQHPTQWHSGIAKRRRYC